MKRGEERTAIENYAYTSMASLPETLKHDLAAVHTFVAAQHFISKVTSITTEADTTDSTTARDEENAAPPGRSTEDTSHAKDATTRRNRSDQKNAVTATAATAKSSTTSTRASGSPFSSPEESPAVARTLQQLQEEMTEVTAKLHAERALVARLSLQERCNVATISHLTEALETAEKKQEKLQRSRDTLTDYCVKMRKDAEADETLRRNLLNQLNEIRRDFKELEANNSELVTEAERSTATIAELRDVNKDFSAALESCREKLHSLATVQADLKNAEERVRYYEAAHEKWVADMQRTQKNLLDMQAECVAQLRLTAAMAQEHQAVRAALQQSERRCEAWAESVRTALHPLSKTLSSFHHTDDSFMTAESKKEEEEEENGGSAGSSLHDASGSTWSAFSQLSVTTPFTSSRAEEEEVMDATTCSWERSSEGFSLMSASTAATVLPTPKRSSATTAAPSSSPSRHALFTQQLEAKVADLALQLHAEQQRADKAEARFQQMSLSLLDSSATILALRTEAATLRPQAESLAAVNAQLQGRLLAAESVTEPLVSCVAQAMEAYTEAATWRPAPPHAEVATVPPLHSHHRQRTSRDNKGDDDDNGSDERAAVTEQQQHTQQERGNDSRKRFRGEEEARLSEVALPLPTQQQQQQPGKRHRLRRSVVEGHKKA